MGPSEILGFGRAIGRLGADATHRMRVCSHGRSERAKINSCRAVQVRMSLPPALISFQSPARSFPSRDILPRNPGRRGTGSKRCPPNHSGRPAKKLGPILVCRGLRPRNGAEDSCRGLTPKSFLHRALGVCGRR